MTIFYLPEQVAVNSAGVPLAFAQLFFYKAGTTTNQTVYNNADLASGHAHAQPVVADATGTFPTIYLDFNASVDYRVQLKTAAGALVYDQDNYPKSGASGVTILSTLINYPQTPAEQAASVTPAQFQIVNDYTGLIIPDRFTTNTTPGTTNMTSACQNALAVLRNNGFGEIKFLGKQYLVTDTVFKLLVTDTRIKISGIPLRTVLLNKAAANKPTIQLLGNQYFDIEGLVLIGAAGFPNIGIEITNDGSSNRSGNGQIRRILCQTNGGGIHITDTNTLDIEDYQYWPSGGPSLGATIDANGQPYGVLADGTGAVNAISLSKINISNLNTIANGGCGIKIDGSSSAAAFQNWAIDRVRCEGGTPATFRSLWLRNVAESEVKNYFGENADHLFDKGCNTIEVTIAAAATGTINVDGSSGANSTLTFKGCNAKSFTADAVNTNTRHDDCNYSGAGGFSDLSLRMVRFNTRTTGSVQIPDILGAAATAFGQTSASNLLSNGSTLDVSSQTVYRADANADLTGLILNTGTTPGQIAIVKNKSSHTLTFAASGTSHVADGVSCVIPAFRMMFFEWDTIDSLWYRQ